MGTAQRSLSVLAALGLLSGCGNGPTSPASTAQVPVGALVLRIGAPTCTPIGGGSPIFPEVRTRVTVTKTGSEWLGTASSPAAGDVELRFHATTATLGGTFVEGTIKGTAIHMPELIATPAWDSRVGFGTDGLTKLFGVTFSAGAFATTNGVDGTGSGSVTLGDSAGRSCAGTTFSWSLFPQS
jgi:hypothetical protein